MCRRSVVSRLLGIVAFVIVAAPGALFADTLVGKVLDPQGLAVPNAKVKLLDRASGEQRNAISDKDGTYRFDGIPAGEYVIEADGSTSALSASMTVTVKGEQKQDVTLRVSGAKSEVLVTASSRPQTAAEVGKAIDTVDAEQINQRGIFQISEALKIVPGLQIQTLEGPGSFTTIQTRGLRASDTAVLFDGLRFQDSGSPQNDATSFLEDLTTADTERVEVLRGSGSSLYGSSAMAGVINIVSKSGGGPAHGELRAEGGGLGMFRGTAGIGGGVGKDRFTYSGTLSHVNIADGVRDKSPYKNTSAQGFARFAIRPELSVSGRLLGNNADLTSTESPAFTSSVLANSAPGRVKAIALPTDQLELFEAKQPFTAGNATYIPNQIDPDGHRKSSFFTGMGALQHAVSDNTNYRVAYQGVDTRRGYEDGPGGPGSFEPAAVGTSHFNGRTDTVQARVDQKAGSFNFITGGYEFMNEKYIAFNDTAASSTRTSSLDLAQRSHAIYGQDQITLGPVQVSVSGRAQFFQLEQPVFSGSNPYAGNFDAIETPNAYTGDVSVAYFIAGSQTKLRSHGGNSYRSPSSYERFGGSSTGTTVYGDPRLKPERSNSIDGGVDQWLFGQKLQLSGTLFYTQLDEVILFANTLPAGDPFGRFFGYANGGGGDAKGVELSAHISPTSKTQAQVSYTYANTELNAPTFGTDYYKLLGLAPHTFALSVTQWIMPRLHATFDLYNKGSYDTTLFGASGRLFQFDAVTKANIVVGYTIPFAGSRGIDVYGKIENLFDDVPYEDGFLGAGRWAIVGIRVNY